MDLQATISATRTKFHKEIKKAIDNVWPKLVAIEMSKLGGKGGKGNKILGRKRGPRFDRDELLAKIKKLHAKKLSQANIARELDITQGYVSRLIQDLKVSKPTASKVVKKVAKVARVKAMAKKIKKPPSKAKSVLAVATGTYAEALEKYGSRTEAAKSLGIPRQTFSDRLAAEMRKEAKATRLAFASASQSEAIQHEATS